jgi:hypothetical protein
MDLRSARTSESMAGMASALILFSGSWTLIFLDLGMYALILGIPIALVVWFMGKRKNRQR